MNYLLASYFLSVFLALIAGWNYCVENSWHNCVTIGNMVVIFLGSLVPVANAIFVFYMIVHYIATWNGWTRIVRRKRR